MGHHSTNTIQQEPLEGTGRIEAFSDAVIAIIITLLVLELTIPELHHATNRDALEALRHMTPKLVSFVVSFVTAAIFWVNHHHFFHSLEKSDGPLLWYNNHLLFWLAVLPFATAFIGDYPRVPVVVALYGFVLCMGAAAFELIVWHGFFRGKLVASTVTQFARRSEFNRGLLAVLMYAASIPAAFIHPMIAYAIFIVIPLYYFVPRRVREGEVDQ